MADLISAGELLIDFTPVAVQGERSACFAQNPGGAPANVAVQAKRLGISAGFLGTVGNDSFGRFLNNVLVEAGLEVRGIKQDDEFATTLAFVHLDENGERDFSFYRNPGADTRLSYEGTDLSIIDECKVFCFGSLLMTAEPSRTAVPRLAEYARKKGKITAYDPNWRGALWRDRGEGVSMMRSLVGYADIMKVSCEELLMITGEQDMVTGAEKLFSQGVRLVAVTLGEGGCMALTESFSVSEPAYKTKVVDTTGCGDSFFGALLYRVIKAGKPICEISSEEIGEMLKFANAAGALCAEKKGAIYAMAGKEEIDKCMKEALRL